MSAFSGLGVHLGNLSRLSHARSRSISPENPTGEKGMGGMSTDGPAANAARDLGRQGPVGGDLRKGGQPRRSAAGIPAPRG